MSSRNYDYILTVANAIGFESGNVIISSNTITTAYIANVDTELNLLKVKLANISQEFSVGEHVHSNVAEVRKISSVIYYSSTGGNTFALPISANAVGEVSVALNSELVHPTALQVNLNTNTVRVGNVIPTGVNVAVWVQTANIQATPYQLAVFTGNVQTANSTITGISPSPFIAEKNSFTQNPVVKLISVYYPGEWYPPNSNGNPTNQGAGKAWPNDFPFRIAEINGDFVSDLQYNCTFGGESYTPYPLNMSAIDQSNDGKISEVTITVFNMDNVISALVEDPFIAGNNMSNSVMAVVNNELVHGIDPRTVNFTPAEVGPPGSEAFISLTNARNQGLNYDEGIVGLYGKANASFNRTQTLAVNGVWQIQKEDSRDLLGAVVEIKTTFANFLDYWPEYSTIRYNSGNVIEVVNAMPYRPGDNVKTSLNAEEATIQAIEDNRFLILNNPLTAGIVIGQPLFIVNQDSDPESYVEDVFKIDQLESLNDATATFNLISWLQYFKLVLPKRKYYKNTCQWTYKGAECQYPGPGELPIPGTNLLSNANPIAANNEISTEDVCGKSLEACTLRRNQIHFGGFPATGRTIPRM